MNVRKAAVANQFYPGKPEDLSQQLEELFAPFKTEKKCRCIASITPHAGYIYSGSTAAEAFAKIDFDGFDSLLLMGPAHRVPLSGLAVPSSTMFATPMGNYPLATDLIKQLVATGFAIYDDNTHLNEHSLEVQIPFLQHLGVETPLIPVVVGWSSPRSVAKVIEFVASRSNTLVMVSSDLSHFHTYPEAKKIDQQTTDRILNMEADIQPEEACGCTAINGLLYWLKESGSSIQTVSQCNSGDTAGDKQRVVGYASYLVY